MNNEVMNQATSLVEATEPVQDISNLKKPEGDVVKFFSTFHHTSILLPHIPSDGYTMDANGNNKLPVLKRYDFTFVPMNVKNKNIVSVKESYSIFIVSKEKYGEQFDRLVTRLTELIRQNPEHFYTEEAWEKKHNLHAFELKVVNKTLKSENEKLKQERAELEERIVKLTGGTGASGETPEVKKPGRPKSSLLATGAV